MQPWPITALTPSRRQGGIPVVTSNSRAFTQGIVTQPSVTNLSDRRGYDPMPFAAGTNLRGRAYSGGIVLQASKASVTNLSVRRGYDPMPFAASTNPGGRAYSGGVVVQATQPAVTNLSCALARGYDPLPSAAPVSAVDGANPSDTPWGPRAVIAADGAGPVETPWGPWYPR